MPGTSATGQEVLHFLNVPYAGSFGVLRSEIPTTSSGTSERFVDTLYHFQILYRIGSSPFTTITVKVLYRFKLVSCHFALNIVAKSLSFYQRHRQHRLACHNKPIVTSSTNRTPPAQCIRRERSLTLRLYNFGVPLRVPRPPYLLNHGRKLYVTEELGTLESSVDQDLLYMFLKHTSSYASELGLPESTENPHPARHRAPRRKFPPTSSFAFHSWKFPSRHRHLTHRQLS